MKAFFQHLLTSSVAMEKSSALLILSDLYVNFLIFSLKNFKTSLSLEFYSITMLCLSPFSTLVLGISVKTHVLPFWDIFDTFITIIFLCSLFLKLLIRCWPS